MQRDCLLLWLSLTLLLPLLLHLLLLLRHQVHIGDTVRLGLEVSEGKGKTRTQVGLV
jgi:hypothetical protein